MKKKEKGRKEKKVFLRENTVANLKKFLEVERLLEVFFWCLLSKLGFREPIGDALRLCIIN